MLTRLLLLHEPEEEEEGSDYAAFAVVQNGGVIESEWSALATLCRRERGLRDDEKETVQTLWSKLDPERPHSPQDADFLSQHLNLVKWNSYHDDEEAAITACTSTRGRISSR